MPSNREAYFEAIKLGVPKPVVDFALREINGFSFLDLTKNFENEINDYRKILKEKNVADIESQKYSYQMGVHYMDVVNDCEKLGDYVVNVVEAHVNRRLSVV